MSSGSARYTMATSTYYRPTLIRPPGEAQALPPLRGGGLISIRPLGSGAAPQSTLRLAGPKRPGASVIGAIGPVRIPALMAAAREAPAVAARGETTYHELPCRSLLNRCTSEQMPFEWTINPYRGCEFGCGYCYARYTHEFIGMEETHLFETRIYAKRAAAEALERDLSRAASRRGAIAIGTATDPYQPAERRMKVTRSLLEVFARKEGLDLSITTKGALVTRDIDLLQRIAERNDLTINMTITTLSRRLARLLEPRAPRPGRRLEAVKALSDAGLRTGVFIMPVIPGITDAPESLDALVGAAARAGAAAVGHQVLFLRDSAKRVFFPLLKAAYPRVASRLRRAYGSNSYYSEDYRAKLDGLMRALRRKHGIQSRRESSGMESGAEQVTWESGSRAGGAGLNSSEAGRCSSGSACVSGAAGGSACVAGGALRSASRVRRFSQDPQLPLGF